MKSFIILFFATFAWSAEITRDAINNNKDIEIHHDDFGDPVGSSLLEVTCRGAQVSFSLSTTATSLVDHASIQVGNSGDPACKTDISAYPVTMVVTNAHPCGRVGSAEKYNWTVEITEYLKNNFGPSSHRVRISQANVECAKIYGELNTVEIDGPDGVQEGTSIQFEDIPFELLKDESQSNNRYWVLRLRPRNPSDLDQLSYTVNSLRATDGSGSNESLSIIENGCVRDPSGIRVSRDASATTDVVFRLMAFRFANNPNGRIDFSATVSPCDKVGENHCVPVKRSDECPYENNRLLRARRDIPSDKPSFSIAYAQV